MKRKKEGSQSCSSNKSILCILMSLLSLLCVIVSVSLAVTYRLQAMECLAGRPIVERMDIDGRDLPLNNKIKTLTHDIRAMEDTIKILRKSIAANNGGFNGIELVGGNEKSGNILVHGRPVCDDEWQLPAAEVACRMLGFEGAEEKTTHSHFGEVSENFIMDDVKCGGEESDLFHCSFDSKSIQCDQYEGAGVVCK
eukprot:GFUD01008639.1.p1 GENE.GFUD01008639.1~~GFUD01008639.1.p1  ORF type:complete len:196 (+),score=57.25 GFUD01008639.1:37-624(+)